MRLLFTVIFITLASVALASPPSPPSGSGLPSGCTANQVAVDDGSGNWSCDDQAGAAGGDSITVDSGAVVDPDFDSGGGIGFTDTSNTITADLNANSVDSAAYVDGSIDVEHLSANSVDSAAYVDGSIDVEHLSANSVDSDSYVDGSIDPAHLADDDFGAFSVSSGVATNETITITDNENTNEANAVIFTSGGDVDGDAAMALESDGDLNYNPSTGTLSVPIVSLSGDLTVGGDDITMGTNTDTAILVADGTNFNPVVPSGDVSITNAGETTVTDLTIASEAVGTIIQYGSGGTWQVLAPGTDGYYLKSNGAGSELTYATPSGGGDVTAVGACETGDCFVDGSTTSTSLVFEMTDNASETTLTAREPEQDNTIYLPDASGDIVVGPANGFGTDNILIKANGTEGLTQDTGIVVDDSNNMSSIGTIGSGAITSTGNITSGDSFIIGSADIEEAELEILDGATADTADVNIIDGISDSGDLTAAELLHVDGVTSAIQTQLDARALESVVGTSLNADDLELDGEVLQTAAEIPHVDANEAVSGVWEIQDDTLLNFGNDADFGIRYDETTDDQLEIVSNSETDTEIDINNAGDGDTNLTIDGDINYAGSLTYTGSGDSYIGLNNNASLAGSGYQIFFEAGNLTSVENGTEKILLNEADGATLTGTSWDFGGVTNFKLPTAAADSSGEISISTGDQLKWHDGTKVVTIDTTTTTDNYVLKYDNATATFNLEADATGGTPAWSDVTDPTSDVAIDHDAGEETAFTFTGNYTTGAQFLIQQATGNPTGGTLFEVQGADSDSSVFEVGDGTNVWTVSTAGLLTNAGTATLNFAAASDLTIGGSQIDHDDMAGTANVVTSGDVQVGDDVLLADGAVVGITGNEVITFNAAGSINVTGAIMDVDGAFTAGTVTSDGTVAGTTGDFSAGVDLGTSQALTGTTAVTIGDNNQTVAINSSDWDIDATGAITGVGAITSDGLGTFDSLSTTEFTVSDAGAVVTSGSVDITGSGGLILENDETITNSVDGTVEISGALSAKPAFQTDASGAITIQVNAVNYGTDTGDADIPATACDAAGDVGNWVVLITSVADSYSLTSDDTDNQFVIAANAAALTADNELDVDGTMVSVMCIAQDLWKVTGYMGAIPTDGGAAD
jgi:hypothetical protein